MKAKNALTRLAFHARDTGGPDDKRTLDQLRIDCLVDALVDAAENLHPTNNIDDRGDGGDCSRTDDNAPDDTTPHTPDVDGRIPDNDTTDDEDLPDVAHPNRATWSDPTDPTDHPDPVNAV